MGICIVLREISQGCLSKQQGDASKGAFKLKVCWIPTNQKDKPQENPAGAVLVFAN